MGYWRIPHVGDAWDLRDELDIDDPAHIAFDDAGRGELAVYLFSASLDGRCGGDRLQFTWEGRCALDEMCGRGTAALRADGGLEIDLWTHYGDEIDFRAAGG